MSKSCGTAGVSVTLARLLAIGILSAAPACAADRPFEQGEHTASVYSAVGGGTIDDADEFPYVGAIAGTDNLGQPGGAFCSAFLASRRFVVTAAHCFNNTGKHLKDNLDVIFATDSTLVSVPDPRIFSHVYIPGGGNLIARNIATRVDSGNNADTAHDVAVIRTDLRVSTIDPIRPAGVGGFRAAPSSSTTEPWSVTDFARSPSPAAASGSATLQRVTGGSGLRVRTTQTTPSSTTSASSRTAGL